MTKNTYAENSLTPQAKSKSYTWTSHHRTAGGKTHARVFEIRSERTLLLKMLDPTRQASVKSNITQTLTIHRSDAIQTMKMPAKTTTTMTQYPA